ncbi:RNA-binding protein [Vibrio sp. UCD-FRSSP16_10]|uniref:ASCH domain-containing protein n=1 Tax=unclassified Vibrio TaxID=2614977 RepID=UPI0007FE1036|nr:MULTISPECIES: ASCH domain-containing protein [unclassified Vibrio]OBT09395.1 RNA-binding protein [Vibrio sp. UCD-FRSSP16_30]OBT22074.1 RNA-binding protein [Vibrio sp. UCD-FRSSP16_10]
MDGKSQAYLDKYLSSLTEIERDKYQSFSSDYFCGDETNANVCAELIRIGQKTATCSLSIWYESGEEPMPTPGHLQVVVDWSGNPVCIIEIDRVETCQYKDVTAEFAYAEGEGDRSLNHWREAHWDFFSNECQQINIEPSEDLVLVLEHFHVVYQ